MDPDLESESLFTNSLNPNLVRIRILRIRNEAGDGAALFSFAGT
jgi:hypothetical protein